ncbi:MAG: hypothetical protein EOO26_02125 [Comamonadaceae bacterium]|nr:MAG: hypothetical protein EOO26_02125 [Comamonadaceae bacterium]
MLRLLFLTLALALPVALVYFAGVWSLVAAVALVAILFAFSARQATGEEIDQGGGLTGYRSSALGDL